MFLVVSNSFSLMRERELQLTRYFSMATLSRTEKITFQSNLKVVPDFIDDITLPKSN